MNYFTAHQELEQSAPHKIRPHVFLGLNFSSFIQFWLWNRSNIRVCPAPLASTWCGSPPSWLHSAASWAWNSPGSSGTYPWSLNFTGVYWICNCIFHKSRSILRFFSFVWLALVLMLTIFYCPMTKNFRLTSFHAKKRKRCLLWWQVSFFSCKKARQNKMFLSQDGEKWSAPAQGQTTHIGKISGRCNFCGGSTYNIKRSQLMWRALYCEYRDRMD